jgi:hypothetical protein
MLDQDNSRELVRLPRRQFQRRFGRTSLKTPRCAVRANAVIEVLLVFGAVAGLASVALLGALVPPGALL